MLDLDQLPASQLLNEREVASILGIKHKTLTSWRHTRQVDIPFVRLGGAVRYRAGDLREFLEANTRKEAA